MYQYCNAAASWRRAAVEIEAATCVPTSLLTRTGEGSPADANAMLYIVGLGLGDERGVTVRGLDAVRRCARVYMEAYTALLTLGPDRPSRLDSLVRFRDQTCPPPVRSKACLASPQAVAHALPRPWNILSSCLLEVYFFNSNFSLYV